MPKPDYAPLPKPKDWRPTVAELRAYAAACSALADRLETANAPKNGAAR